MAKSTRLTKDARQQILRAVARRIPMTKMKELSGKVQAIVNESIASFAPRPIAQCWADKETRAHLRMAHVNIFAHSFGKEDKIPTTYKPMDILINAQVVKNVSIDNAMRLERVPLDSLSEGKILALKKEAYQERESVIKALEELNMTLLAFNTVEALIEQHPELKDFVPEMVAPKSYPVAVTTNVVSSLKALGWPTPVAA